MADSTKLSLIMGARNGALEERDSTIFTQQIRKH